MENNWNAITRRVNDKFTEAIRTHKIVDNIQTFNVKLRSQLIDDAFTLANAEQLTYRTPLSLLSSLSIGRENSYLTWRSVREHLDYIWDMLRGTEAEALMKVKSRQAPNWINYIRTYR